MAAKSCACLTVLPMFEHFTVNRGNRRYSHVPEYIALSSEVWTHVRDRQACPYARHPRSGGGA